MSKETLSHFVKYQIVYSFIVYVIVTWTLFGFRLAVLEKQVAKNTAELEANQSSFLEIKTRLASIDTSLAFIKESLRD